MFASNFPVDSLCATSRRSSMASFPSRATFRGTKRERCCGKPRIYPTAGLERPTEPQKKSSTIRFRERDDRMKFGYVGVGLMGLPMTKRLTVLEGPLGRRL